MLRSTKKVSQTNKAIVMQEFTQERFYSSCNGKPLGSKRANEQGTHTKDNKIDKVAIRPLHN